MDENQREKYLEILREEAKKCPNFSKEIQYP
jgi:hypothetical protein